MIKTSMKIRTFFRKMWLPRKKINEITPFSLDLNRSDFYHDSSYFEMP